MIVVLTKNSVLKGNSVESDQAPYNTLYVGPGGVQIHVLLNKDSHKCNLAVFYKLVTSFSRVIFVEKYMNYQT